MLRLIAIRIVQGLITVLVITFIVFVLMNSSGDPAILLVPPDAPLEQVELMRTRMGLNQPLLIRYGLFLKNAAVGEFGASFRSRQPAMQTVLRHLGNTAILALASMVLTTLMAFPLGILAGTHRGSLVDTFATLFSVVGQSIPLFWLGMLGILLFSIRLDLLPPVGMGGWRHLILPALTLAWYSSAPLVRLIRTALVETYTEDYIRTARSKGLSGWQVLWKHAFKNAAIPVITLYGLTFGDLLVGSVVTETVFAWPGLGRLTIMAVLGRDFPIVLAGVCVIAFIFVLVNLLVDLSYLVLNPRVSVG